MTETSHQTSKFNQTPEIAEFRKVLKKFFAENFGEQLRKSFLIDETSIEKRRKMMASAEAKAIYEKYCNLGALSVGLPENFGGLGLGNQALAAIIEETAQNLFPFPVFETAVLGLLPAWRHCNSGEVSAIVGSNKTITSGFMSYFNMAFAAEEFASAIKVRSNVDSITITGKTVTVPGFFEAEIFLMPVVIDGLIFICAINNLTQQSIKVSNIQTLDLLREYSEVTFNSTAVKIISPALVISDLENTARLIACLAVCELVGVTRASLELATGYVRERQQFGKAVGSFQAIQHMLADAHLHLEEASSLLNFALWSSEHSLEQFAQSATAAVAYAKDVLPRAIEDCLQAHGGIGFTFEYPIHLYLRRAQSISMLLERPQFSYAAVSNIVLQNAGPAAPY